MPSPNGAETAQCCWLPTAPQVLQIVNRIIVMDNGKVVMDGPRDLVLQNLMQSEQQNRAKQQANHPAVQQNTQAQPAKAASANS